MSVSGVRQKQTITLTALVQLWSMKNYHYYLKQELYSHDTQKPRFRGFKWHPEDPLSLYIICQGKNPLYSTQTKPLCRLYPAPHIHMGHLCRPSTHAARYRLRRRHRRHPSPPHPLPNPKHTPPHVLLPPRPALHPCTRVFIQLGRHGRSGIRKRPRNGMETQHAAAFTCTWIEIEKRRPSRRAGDCP